MTSSIKVWVLLAIIFFGISFAIATEIKPLKVGPRDKCPVCGMFVTKYPDFAAQILFRDGSVVHFDGAKDMFKYYLQLPRYAPGKNTAEISAAFVTNYYDLTMTDGRTAFYVIGSDVYGPMGRELIPFARKPDAVEFIKDHKGNSIISFRDVSLSTLRPLD